MKKIMLVFGIFLLSISLVLANGDHQSEIEEGKKLVDSGISCDKLTDEQLESIGEYYMEQMHPGEQHEAMHKMMGMEEGTEYHEQVHVNMARMMYCGEGGMMGDGMMNGGMMGANMMGMMPMMMNMMGSGGMNMMGANMMDRQTPQTNMMQGMMGNWGYSGYWDFWNIIWLLFWIGIIISVVWLIYKFIIKKEAVSETPINILKKRFAKGEISKKQFEEMKKEIGE